MPKAKEIDYVGVRELALQGESRDTIAKFCGLSSPGFYARLKKDEALAEALAAGAGPRKKGGKPQPAAEPEPEREPHFEPVVLEAEDESPGEHPNSDLRCGILDAISHGFRLKRYIASDVDLPVWIVDRELDAMVADGELECYEGPTFEAYFSPGTMVADSRYVLNGEGGVDLVADAPVEPEGDALSVAHAELTWDELVDRTPTKGYVHPVSADQPEPDVVITITDDEPEWYCLSCLKRIDPNDEAVTIFRDERKAWCAECFDDVPLNFLNESDAVLSTTVDEDDEAEWYCLGCHKLIDPNDPSTVVFRNERKAWCDECFDDVPLELTPGKTGLRLAPDGTQAKPQLLNAIRNPDTVSCAFADGSALTIDFNGFPLSLLKRERRLIRDIWKALDRFDEAGGEWE